MSCTRLFQRGRVVSLDGTTAQIAFESVGGCAACHGGQGCGLATFAALFATPDQSVLAVRFSAPLELAIGDAVRVGINARRLLQLTVATYLGPLVGIGIGAVAGSTLVPAAGDLAAVVGAVVGALLTSGILLLSAARRRSLAWLGAQITRL